MSFDVFLECFGETEHSGLSRELVRSLFSVVDRDSNAERRVGEPVPVSYVNRFFELLKRT
jgi:hypothetical protein